MNAVVPSSRLKPTLSGRWKRSSNAPQQFLSDNEPLCREGGVMTQAAFTTNQNSCDIFMTSLSAYFKHGAVSSLFCDACNPLYPYSNPSRGQGARLFTTAIIQGLRNHRWPYWQVTLGGRLFLYYLFIIKDYFTNCCYLDWLTTSRVILFCAMHGF